MGEAEERFDGKLLSPSDATTIGFTIVDMADRVSRIRPMVPGAKAEWEFEMEGTRYNVIVSVAPPLSTHPLGKEGS